MYKEVFAERLKKARKNIGFTQREVSKETGISQPNIARYETGDLEPSIETLGILADFYNISIDWLLGLGKSKSQDENERQIEILNQLEKTAQKDARLAK